jgi:hypothetical protein
MRAMSKTWWLVLLLGLITCRFANKNLHISEISAGTVRGIFIGAKTRFADGSHAVPVILKGGPVHEVFLKNYVGESPEEFRARWRKAVFTGQGAIPKTCDSESALIEYVAATPGALGYVSRISPQDNVKTLTPLK